MKFFTSSVKGNGMIQFQIHINMDEDEGSGSFCRVGGSEMGRENDRNEFFQIKKKKQYHVKKIFFQQNTAQNRLGISDLIHF